MKRNFTYYGFQYAEITGLPYKPAQDTLHAVFLHSDVEPAGRFACSNELFNKLQHATHWAFLSNLYGIPTDCPHREKNGWTGDAHLAAEQALFNFKPAPVYEKWINDIVDTQTADGMVCAIVPTSGWGYEGANGPSWDSAMFLIPHYVYTYTGDPSLLTSHYEAFKKYIDYNNRRFPDHIIRWGLGDWVPWKSQTTVGVTSTAYFYRDLLITAQTADLLGKKEDAAHFRDLAEQTKQAFNKAFFNPTNNTYDSGSQTALSCAVPGPRPARASRRRGPVAAECRQSGGRSHRHRHPRRRNRPDGPSADRTRRRCVCDLRPEDPAGLGLLDRTGRDHALGRLEGHRLAQPHHVR